MVSIETQVKSEKEWDLSLLMDMLTEAQELNDDAQARMIAKRALEQSKKQGNKEWQGKFQAILDDYYSKIRFDELSSKELKACKANARKDLSEIKGIEENIAIKLRSSGFTSVQSLASNSPEQLIRVPGVGISTAQKLIANAQEHLENNIFPQSNESTLSEPQTPVTTPYQKLKERTSVKNSPKPAHKNNINSYGPKLTEWVAKPSKTSPTIIRDFPGREEGSNSSEDSLQQLMQNKHKKETERQVPEIVVQIEDIREEYTEDVVSPTIQEEIEEVLSIEDTDQEESNKNHTFSLQKNRFIEDEDFSPLKRPIFPSKRNIAEVQEKTEYSQSQSTPKYVKKNTTPRYSLKTSRIPYQEQKIKVLPNAEQLVQRQQSAQKILGIVREMGMFEIPMNIPELREVFRAVDLLACKPMRGDNGRCIILLIPIKHVLTADPVYVWDSHVMTGQINSNPTTTQNMAINTHTKKLLQACEYLFNDMINGRALISLVARHIGISMKTNLRFKNQRLYLGSGEIEYQIIIDPVLLCDTQVYCMEKTLSYAYQQGSNLHVVSHFQLEELFEYLEMKYRLLISHNISQNAIMKVNDAKISMFKQLQLFSLPFLAYGVLFCFFLILGFQEAVRFCISLGFGLIFVYGSYIGYLIYHHFHSLKNIGSEFSVPYHQKPINLSEEDFILINDQLPPEWMTQFSYEVENQLNSSYQERLRCSKSRVNTSSNEKEEISQIITKNSHSSSQNTVRSKYQEFLDD